MFRSRLAVLTVVALLLALSIPCIASAEAAEASAEGVQEGERPAAPTVDCAAVDDLVLPGDRHLTEAACTCPNNDDPPQVAHGWACGSTCAEARTNCRNDAMYQAEPYCLDICATGSITYTACVDASQSQGMCAAGQVFVDCDLEYWCLECF